MILSDNQIRIYAERHEMINPFVPEMIRRIEDRRVISYGLGSYGYDIRCSNEFRVMNAQGDVVDIKNSESVEDAFYTVLAPEYIIVPPHGFVLGSSVEYFRIPRRVTGICLGKSSYARVGLHPLMTPLESGWEGNLTLEFANLTPCPIKLYVNEGVAQILFVEAPVDCDVSYADRGGKYQSQSGVTLGRV